MAGNIFSGLFNNQAGSGNAAMRLSRYNQEIEDYQSAKKAAEQAQAMQAMREQLGSVRQEMTPERQNMMSLSEIMGQNPATFNNGMQMLNDMVGQRGGTIADWLKQDKSLAVSNAKQRFKVDNPTADSINKKIETAKYYASLDEKGKQLFRDSVRDRQYVDTENEFTDVYSKETIDKNLIRAGVSKALVPDMTDRLTNFYKNVNNTETGLDAIADQRDTIKMLYETAPGSTGWYSFLKILPGSKAMTWEQRRDTIVANIGLDKILELKASSAQGATGLGALNEKELEMLQKHKGSLEQAQNFEEVQRILKSLDEGMAKASLRMRRELIGERNWYKKNQYLAGNAPDAELSIFDKQQRLFSLGEYERGKPLSTLGVEQEPGDVQTIEEIRAAQKARRGGGQ